VRLVDDDEVDRPGRDEVDEAGSASRSGVKTIRARPRRSPSRRVDLVASDGAVELDRGDAELAQLLALVLHQRDQGETTSVVPGSSSAGS
jgi:hypothetical protein